MLSFFKKLRSTLDSTNETEAPTSRIAKEDFAYIEDTLDSSFYLYRYPDVLEAGLDAFEHFVTFGWREGRDPNPYTHLAFVRNIYPEAFSDLNAVDDLFSRPIFHNALLTEPLEFSSLREKVEGGIADCEAAFAFDVEMYSKHQKDVLQRSHLNPVQHLFYDGLYQNRLRAGGHLNPVLLDLSGYPNDYSFLIDQSEPLSATEFSKLDLSSGRTSEDDVNLTEFYVGIGIILYKNSQYEMTRLLQSIQAEFEELTCASRLHIWNNAPDPIEPSVFEAIVPGLDIVFSERPDNPGFAKGHNGLMAECFESGCTHYLGLNPDGYLLPGSLENVLRFAATKEKGSLIELDSEPLSHPKWYHPVTGETDWVSGAAFLLDAKAYDLTEGFDPDFPMYCEDIDLSFRAFEAGVSLFVAPNARYYHDSTYRLYTKEKWRDLRAMAGLWYLCEKWGNVGRANFVLNEMASRGEVGSDTLKRPPLRQNVSPKIQELLKKERFSRSRYWGE